MSSEASPYVFQYVKVYPVVTDKILIEWKLHRKFNFSGPYTYEIQFSRSGVQNSGDWTAVGNTTENDKVEVNASISGQRAWSTASKLFVRVKVTLPDNTEFFSHAVPAWGSLPRKEHLYARDLIRRELLHQKKTHAGTPGYLLKRKTWGELATDHIDPNTREVIDPYNTTSYGTPFKGGYFPAMEYWLAFQAGTTSKINETKQGTNHNIAKQARAIAYPLPQTYDVWVDGMTNSRYYLDRVVTSAEMRGVPVIIQLLMREAPPTDVIYEVPLQTSNQGQPIDATTSSITSYFNRYF